VIRGAIGRRSRRGKPRGEAEGSRAARCRSRIFIRGVPPSLGPAARLRLFFFIFLFLYPLYLRSAPLPDSATRRSCSYGPSVARSRLGRDPRRPSTSEWAIHRGAIPPGFSRVIPDRFRCAIDKRRPRVSEPLVKAALPRETQRTRSLVKTATLRTMACGRRWCRRWCRRWWREGDSRPRKYRHRPRPTVAFIVAVATARLHKGEAAPPPAG
jgi:hypothetical protein